MEAVQYIPGAIGGGAPGHTLPLSAPDIEAVVSAEITRLPASLAAHADNPAAPVAHGAGAAFNHVNAAVDAHTVTQPDNHVLSLIAPLGAGGAVTLPNGAQMEVAGGPWNDGGATASPHANAAVDPHVVTQPDPHPAADIVAALVDHPAADIAGALVDHVGADPVVAAGAIVRLTRRTFTLANATLEGDLLTVAYHAVGERVAVS